MKRLMLGFMALVTMTLSQGCAKMDGDEAPNDDKVKVVAYLPMWKMPYAPQWDKITHLNLSFGKVNPNGTLDMAEILANKKIISEAHDNGVKVLVSIGGGGSHFFSDALLNDGSRNTLVDEIAMWTDSLALDGVDVDYEEWDGGPGGVGDSDIPRREALEAFYRHLREKLGDEKLITAAVNASWDNGGWGTYNCFTNTMHQYLDFVNLMIYDETGPWSGERTGQHAGMDFFDNAVRHWLVNRQLPKHKLIAGLPFYGYKFSRPDYAGDAEGVAFRDILEQYPDSDAYRRDNIGLLYYNGAVTIRKKCKAVMTDSLGGVMFWEITQDSPNPETSLLSLIDSIFTEK